MSLITVTPTMYQTTSSTLYRGDFFPNPSDRGGIFYQNSQQLKSPEPRWPASVNRRISPPPSLIVEHDKALHQGHTAYGFHASAAAALIAVVFGSRCEKRDGIRDKDFMSQT